ncbi:unnamed protein product [Rhodiola kirilowii]
MLTFPLIPLPPDDMTPEQIKALLPPMESSQFKRWNCAHCVAEYLIFQAGYCAVHQLNGEGGPSDVTRKDNNFMADKINVDTSPIIVPADDHNTTDSDLLNTEKPKALFDLNETPTPEDSDEILENEAEELAMDNTAKYCHLAPVDEKHIGNTNEPAQTSEIRSDDSIDDDIIIPQTIRRRPVKYRALSELSDQDKREEGQNVDSNGTDHEMVPTPDPQPKKKIKLNKKKKKKKSQHYSRIIQAKQQGPERCRAAHEKSNKKRTFDFNLPLEQNFLQAGVSLQSPAAPCAKRKHHDQVSPDQNENSDTLISDSSEKGTAGTLKEMGKRDDYSATRF